MICARYERRRSASETYVSLISPWGTVIYFSVAQPFNLFEFDMTKFLSFCPVVGHVRIYRHPLRTVGERLLLTLYHNCVWKCFNPYPTQYNLILTCLSLNIFQYLACKPRHRYKPRIKIPLTQSVNQITAENASPSSLLVVRFTVH